MAYLFEDVAQKTYNEVFKMVWSVAMPHQVLADTCISISELKKNPSALVAQGQGFPVAVLNRNEPDFYCIPAAAWEEIVDRLEDVELNAIADARQGQKAIEVSIDDS